MTEKKEKSNEKSKVTYVVKPSFADDGTPRFAVGHEENDKFVFMHHVRTQGEADSAVKDYEERDKREAEEQKERDKQRDANKVAGFHAAEKRGEYIPPEMQRWTKKHDAVAAKEA
jgi:hypothetical protein